MVKRWLFFLLLVLATISGVAQSVRNSRPKIGLVLSGGGAKGFAHIGVLKVLEECGIKVDYITGTSMGSIIGALYAIGYSPIEIERIVRETDWDDVVYDKTSLRSISIEEKEDFSRYIGELAIVKGKLTLPKGLIIGQKLGLMLSHLTWSVHNVDDFDHFQIPFRCVSTNIETGEAVVHSRGFLPDALRASMAIPTIYTPMEIDGKLLVDGMLIRNFPVSDAIDMGADIIIGSDVGAPLYKKEQLSSMFEIIDQASSFRGAAENIKQQKLCNYLIIPNVDGYNTSSFTDFDSLIARGQRAALALKEPFKKLADSISSLGENNRERRLPASLHSLKISKIQIEGLNHVSKNVVLGSLAIGEENMVSLEQIEKGIERIYGTRFFERVGYRIKRENEQWILVISIIERTNSIFRFGFNYSNDLNAALLLNSTFRNFLGEGSKLMVDLKLSENLGAKVSYSFFTRWKPNIGWKANVIYNQLDAKIYSDEQKLTSLFNVQHFTADLSLASSISNAVLVYTGIVGDWMNVSSDMAVNDTIGLIYKALSYQFVFRKDDYDRAVYPQKGSSIYLEFRTPIKTGYDEDFNWDKRFWKILASYKRIWPICKQLAISSEFTGGIIVGDNIHYGQLFYLGTQHPNESNMIPFTGIGFMGQSTRNFIATTQIIRIQPVADKFISLKASFGNLSDKATTIFDLDNRISGYGANVGWNTVIGPIEFGFNKSSLSKKWIKEVKIGYFF
jgi:NTE family protein